jgi:hypothetical protein
MASQMTHRIGGPLGAAVLAVIFLLAAALGAYGHWILWHPMDGVLIYFAAGAALLTAAVIAIAATRSGRRLALVPVVVGIGLVAGSAFGPSRPELRSDHGLMVMTLERPNAASGEGAAMCDTVEDGSELQVSSASRLDILEDDLTVPADIDQREFVTIGLRVGDRWQDGAIRRSDDVDVVVIVGGVAADAPEVRLAASDDSTMEIQWTNDGGSLRFDGLVVDPSDGAAPGGPIDLAGTMTWTCRLPEPTPAAVAMAEAACAGATFGSCRDDLLLTMQQAPGSLVAICDYADGQGEILPLERESDAEAGCIGGGASPSGRVVDVIRLP